MRSQQGLGLLEVLVIVALVAEAVYFASMSGAGQRVERADCATARDACMTDCRHATLEAADVQGCERICRLESDACEGSVE
ncbi:MAG: hypothetical protein WDZ63_01585 [Burkholderiales bacterium]